MDPNARQALLERRETGSLTWRGPVMMLFARAAFAVAAQAVAAVALVLRASPTSWHDSEAWLPVYGTLIDGGCLTLLWRLTRREGIGLFDLVEFDRARLCPRCATRLRAHSGEPRIHFRRDVCGRLDRICDCVG